MKVRLRLIQDYVGKKVVVRKTDGFTKFGKCKGIDDFYVLLEYDNGGTEMIRHSEIVTIKEDSR